MSIPTILNEAGVHIETVVFGAAYNGPEGRANGGYAAGRLASFVGNPAEITLWNPIPLDAPLDVVRSGDRIFLTGGDLLIAEARYTRMDLDVPPAPTFEKAVEASRSYGAVGEHPFPSCFVCGPERRDGLRILPGAIEGGSLFAAPWTPSDDLAGPYGLIRPEFIWAALDCPGGIAALAHDPRPAVLGRLAGEIRGPVWAERRYVVAAWVIRQEGRKHITGTAVFDEQGQLHACAQATWIEVAK